MLIFPCSLSEMLIKKLSIPLEKLVVLSRICKIQQSLILTFFDSTVRSGLSFLRIWVISLFKFDFAILTNLVVSFTELCSFSFHQNLWLFFYLRLLLIYLKHLIKDCKNSSIFCFFYIIKSFRINHYFVTFFYVRWNQYI